MPDYRPIVKEMILVHNIRVRKWRTNMSGCAWRVYYRNGRVINWIESPIPRTPVSLAIFLHEVGHHVIGFDRYKTRCQEEYYAWEWALDEMRQFNIEKDKHVIRRYILSMQYAVAKALRRRIKVVPPELRQFLPEAA